MVSVLDNKLNFVPNIQVMPVKELVCGVEWVICGPTLAVAEEILQETCWAICKAKL